VNGLKKEILMKKETGKTIRELGYFASLGMSVALSIFIGLGLGLWLDKKFDTNPVLMFVGLILGIVAGFSNIVRAGKKGKNY
jgi:ATP synthase protein I